MRWFYFKWDSLVSKTQGVECWGFPIHFEVTKATKILYEREKEVCFIASWAEVSEKEAMLFNQFCEDLRGPQAPVISLVKKDDPK